MTVWRTGEPQSPAAEARKLTSAGCGLLAAVIAT